VRAVSDAGPLIHLSWIGQLDLLDQLFTSVLVPAEVRDEALGTDDSVRGMAEIRAFFNLDRVEVRSEPRPHDWPALSVSLHRGEQAAITLMQVVDADVLLIDDRLGRREAERLGLPVLGTVGILRECRNLGYIEQVYPYLLALRGSGFRISDPVVEMIAEEESHT
jgi:uncharacterized protein